MNMKVKTEKEFRKVLKDKFIFCYSPKVMNYLRHRGCRYICKSNHEMTNSPFWLYMRTPDVEEMMTEYRDSLNREVPEVEGF
jgi:hypothetical protein